MRKYLSEIAPMHPYCVYRYKNTYFYIKVKPGTHYTGKWDQFIKSYEDEERAKAVVHSLHLCYNTRSNIMSKFKVGDIVRIIGAESQLIFQYPYVLDNHSAMGDMIITRIVKCDSLPGFNDPVEDTMYNHTYVDIERCDGREFTKCVPNSEESYQSKYITIDEADLELVEDRRM